MATVLRVKRGSDYEPLDSLVIACKRHKSDDVAEAEKVDSSTTTIVKFAGTIKSQNVDVVEHLAKALHKDELKTRYKKHTVDVINKARERSKQSSIENRYKVISCYRSLHTWDTNDPEDKVTTVIDVEDSTSCTTQHNSTGEKGDDYVYDLYYVQTNESTFNEESISIYALDQELGFDCYGDVSMYSGKEYESEDSNSESNWRNDYPDSDDHHSENSIDECDMRKALMNMKLDEESSSEDDFVYAVDETDVECHGYKYAKYKAKVKGVLDDDCTDESEVESLDYSENDENGSEREKESFTLSDNDEYGDK